MDALSEMAFDEAPIGLVLTEHRVIRAVNRSFATLVGYDRAALIGQSFAMLYASPREFEDIRDIGVRTLRESGAYTDERLLHRHSAPPVWCRFRAKTLTRDDPLARVVLSYAVISEFAPEVSLSPREREVVLYLNQGMTSKEIGIALGLSPRTIEDVRARLLRKLGVRNVAELLAKLTKMEV